MLRKKHKRKVSRIVIFTTDAADAKVRQLRIHPWITGVLTLAFCCMAGALIGYTAYEGQIWQQEKEKDDRQTEAMAVLEQEKLTLQTEIDTLNAKLEVLSATVQQQSQAADELQEELAQQSLPTDYPLTGSAAIEEVTEGDPMVIFVASEGITAVASAKGTVLAVEEDEFFGNRVVVDHGNGYVSIYRNKGTAQVKAGDEVAKGTTLFLIGEDNKPLGYQIMENGVYINPMDMLSING